MEQNKVESKGWFFTSALLYFKYDFPSCTSRREKDDENKFTKIFEGQIAKTKLR